MQLIDTTAEWELREPQTFTSTLVGQTHVSAQSNPFRPLVVATALWQATCIVSPVQAHRTALLRVAAGAAAKLLKNAWAAACTRLETQGVEPGIYRTVLLAPGAVSGRSGAPDAAGPPSVLASLLASMPGGPSSPATGERGGAVLAMGTAAVPVPGAPASATPPAASAVSPLERQTIKLLMTRVFDTIAADPRVPAPFLALLARLQGPALRMALLDPEMRGSTDQPVWQLINRIGEAGAGHPLAGDARTAALLAFCESLIEQLGRAAEPDAPQYRAALTQLDAFMADQRQAQLRAALRAVQMLQLAKRRELLEQRLAQRIVDQMVPVRTTPTVRRFMTGAWAKVLADAMLRDGDDAPTTRDYIKLVDELLWSVQLPDHPQSRQRLISLLPSMLQRLRAGMEQIGLPATEQDSVLDELMAIHTEALRPGRGDAAGLTSEQIVQRMRNEVLPASTGHGGFTDSVIDLASMETVPADMLPGGGSIREPAKRIDALRPGDRLRLLLHGRWSSVQLPWRSDQGLYFLFGGESAGRTHSVTHRALERLNSAGLVQPLEISPLLQRALDSVARELVRPG